MITEQQYKEALKIVHEYKHQIDNEVLEIDAGTWIGSLGFSVRLYNGLRGYGIRNVAGLKMIDLMDFKCHRGIGKRSYNELVKFLVENNIQYINPQ